MKYNCLFLGSSEYSVETLKSLLSCEIINIVAVITQDNKNSKQINPLEKFIESFDHLKKIPLIKKSKINTEFFDELKKYDIDVSVVCAYGVILPRWFINFPNKGTLNFHPSLLPKLRGATPVQSTLLNGDKMTGVTLQKMKFELDEGDIVSQIKFEVDQNYFISDLYHKIYKITDQIINCDLKNYLEGRIKLSPQEGPTSYCYESDFDYIKGEIKNDKEPIVVLNHIKAFEANPGAWIYVSKINFNGKIIEINKKLKIYRAKLTNFSHININFNELIVIDKFFLIPTNESPIQILLAQFEGGKILKDMDIINGLRNKI